MQDNGGFLPEEDTAGGKKKNAGKKALIAVICVLAAALVFAAGFFVSRLTLDSGLKSLLWFKQKIQDEYYEEISDDEFWQAAIDGAEGILDRYSCYYTADEYDAVINSDRGIKGGAGFSFFADTNKIYKVAVGSPAFFAESASGEKAQAGMYLTGVGESEGEIADTFTAAAVSSALSSVNTGETRVLRLSATDAKDTQNCIYLTVGFEVYTESYVLYATNEGTYAEIFNDDASGGVWQRVGEGMRALRGGEAYISLAQFSGNAAEEFAQAAAQYKADGCSTLLFDLRNDGGGSLAILGEIAAYLLKDADVNSPLMYADYGEKRTVFLLGRDLYAEYFADSEIFVAANGNTASASEALIGAMLCYDTIEYENIYLIATGGSDAPAGTYGKGIMQTTFRNPATGEAAKLTTARIYWPDGATCIHERGITTGDGAHGIPAESNADYGDPALLQILEDMRKQ